MNIRRPIASAAVVLGGTAAFTGITTVPAFAACAGSEVGRAGSIPSGGVVNVGGHLYGCLGSSWIVL